MQVLDDDTLGYIFTHFASFETLLKCSTVCKQWWSVLRSAQYLTSWKSIRRSAEMPSNLLVVFGRAMLFNPMEEVVGVLRRAIVFYDVHLKRITISRKMDSSGTDQWPATVRPIAHGNHVVSWTGDGLWTISAAETAQWIRHTVPTLSLSANIPPAAMHRCGRGLYCIWTAPFHLVRLSSVEDNFAPTTQCPVPSTSLLPPKSASVVSMACYQHSLYVLWKANGPKSVQYGLLSYDIDAQQWSKQFLPTQTETLWAALVGSSNRLVLVGGTKVGVRVQQWTSSGWQLLSWSGAHQLPPRTAVYLCDDVLYCVTNSLVCYDMNANTWSRLPLASGSGYAEGSCVVRR
eukprot:TRINITY_DN10769_c0_g1_i1.p1 TRINITY_DN10769_c0_g1~~TRINITY_DN10769_c0_g1_i1.p1  ORF type:complete len:346 (-),score=20.30 TRINITY_DN10769_c0_g1_i1:116-1153(-)